MNILITGGASGLGLEITRQLLLTKEHQVFFTFNKSKTKAEELEKENPGAKGFFCDFRDPLSLDSFLNTLENLRVDALVNNAISHLDQKHFHKTDLKNIKRDFEENVLPILHITQSSIRKFRKQKFGKIITILTSYAVNKPPIGLSSYVAEKQYLASMSRSWATENAPFNITSNCISPATMKTGLTKQTDERVFEGIIQTMPRRQLVKPNDVAECVLFLVGSSQNINGINLIINQGVDVV